MAPVAELPRSLTFGETGARIGRVTTIGAVLALMNDWASRPRPTRGSIRVDGGTGTARDRFWWLRPNHYRLEEADGDKLGLVTVRIDREEWSFREGRLYYQRDTGGSLTVLDNLFMSSFGEPGRRPPAFTGTTTVAARAAALVVVATPWRGHVDAMEMAVDLDTGMVLRRVQLLAGKPTFRIEIEEVEIDAELSLELFHIEPPEGGSVIELGTTSNRRLMLEDLPRVLPFQVWVPNRPRHLQVVSVEPDSSSLKLVWLEDRGGERAIVVNAMEGEAAKAGNVPAELERVDAGDHAVFLGIDKRKTLETWFVQFAKGSTSICLEVRGSRDQALSSAMDLIPLSADGPELMRR